MKPQVTIKKERGLTLLEVVVVIALTMLLAALLLPALSKAGSGRWVGCASNLKQIGLGMRIFSDDHAGRFPWLVPKAEGGSLEYVNSPEVFRHFLAASNEINSPKVLVCPADRERSKESDWDRLSNRNLSYFIGLEARGSQPSSILAGDRTIFISKKPVFGLLALNSNALPRIVKGLHGDFITMVRADGSIQRMYDKNAKNWVLDSNQLPLRLAIP
jgi:competence protein ComGC